MDDSNVGVYREKRNMSQREITPLRRASDRTMQQASAFVASMEIIGDGVVLVDSNARISFISKSAQIILPKLKDIIEINDNQLCFLNASNGQILNAALHKIPVEGEKVSVGEVMVIERPSIARPLILTLFFVSAAVDEEPRLMLVFRDPDMEPTPQWEIFTRHFNLSAIEAKLSLALADGLSINEYSERFFTSPHTTRSHLKSIFAKTGTRRQSDLLRLIFAFTRL